MADFLAQRSVLVGVLVGCLAVLVSLPGCGGGSASSPTGTDSSSREQVILHRPHKALSGHRSGAVRVGRTKVTADRVQASVDKRMEDIRRASPPAHPKRPGGK